MWNMKCLMDGTARILPILLSRQGWMRRVKIHGIMEMIPGSLVIEASGTMGRRRRKVDRANLQKRCLKPFTSGGMRRVLSLWRPNLPHLVWVALVLQGLTQQLIV